MRLRTRSGAVLGKPEVAVQRLSADPEYLQYVWDPAIPPRLTVATGERFVVETEDAFTGRLREEGTLPTPDDVPELASTPARVNPMTGPIFVEGVEAGDTLVVHIERVEPAPTGVIALIPEVGPQWGWRNWSFFDGPKRFTVEHEKGPSGTFADGTLTVDGYTGPLAPLIGTIGVAPEYVAESTIWGQAPHGGVWDNRNVCAGTTLYFPAFHDGGLLSLGDLHGVQGDCEFFGVADEVRGEVELTCDVIKGRRIAYPRMETDDKLIQIYCYRPLEDAVQAATRLLMEWLVDDHGVTEQQAYWLVALNPDFRVVIGNMVNFELINYTVTAEISKASLARAVR
ncbi:MAG: amidase [Solirubrobacteraceae bacterium]|jgi:acetamidase/formamidase|nr:amidase [Solirubrobacteraceae bacterium]